MHKVIQQVLEAEEEAKRILEAARVQCDEIIAKAKRESGERYTFEEAAIEAEAKRMIESATREAETEKRGILARAQTEMEGRIQLSEEVMQQAVTAAVRFIRGYKE